MDRQNEINELVTQAADLIRTYNPQLAGAFLDQPFRRVTLAEGFAAGFKTPNNVTELVYRVAEADQQLRAINAR